MIGTVAGAVRLYLLGGTDTDEGARAGSRADERQQLISLRSRALACNLAAVTSFIGLTAAIAVKATWGGRSWSPSSSRATVTCSAWQLRCRRRGHGGRRGHRTSDALPGQLVTSPAIVALSEGRGSLRASDADREQAVEVFKAASSRLAGARAA